MEIKKASPRQLLEQRRSSLSSGRGYAVLLWAAAALFVTGHLKTQAAPLHPPLAESSAVTAGGQIVLSPRVTTSNQAPVTRTYVS